MKSSIFQHAEKFYAIKIQYIQIIVTDMKDIFSREKRSTRRGANRIAVMAVEDDPVPCEFVDVGRGSL